MNVSIIIPVKPGGFVAAVESLRNLVPSAVGYEVLIAEGRRPSRQRNMAAREAVGEVVYFLDDDSCVVPDALVRIAAHMRDDSVAVVGGPSLTHADNSPFQRSVAWVLASAFGGGAIRNRYRKHGSLRDTDDSELILCNLAFRKDIFLSSGGLDERLYPNEENELIDRLLAGGFRLLHDPELFVTRSQRPTLRAFVRQMLTYGNGRAEQTLVSRRVDAKAIIPSLFVLYLMSLPVFHVWWYLLPAALYLVIVLGNMLMASRTEGFSLVWRLPVIYTLLHACYGAGFISGLFSPRYKKCDSPCDDVNIVRLKAVDSDW